MQNDLPKASTTELTEREQEILKLLATGTSNKDIAQQLFISSNTVKVHLRNIFAKIGATSRTEAAMYAVRSGLVQGAQTSESRDEDIQRAQIPTNGSENSPAVHVIQRRSPLLRWWILLLVSFIIVTAVSTSYFITRNFRATSVQIPLPTSTTVPRWKRLTDLPTARSGLAVTEYDNQLFAIGGQTPSGITGAVEQFDPETNIWLNKASKPLPVTDMSAAVIGGKIYVPGGRLVTGNVTNILEIYDPLQDHWGQGAALPQALSAYAMVSFEGRLYLFGGWDGMHYLDTVMVYDPSRNLWSTGRSMPTSRGFAGAVALNEKIYVVGGFNGSSALTANEDYNPAQEEGISDPWNKAMDLPSGRYGMGVSSIAGSMYIIGGLGNGGNNEVVPTPLMFIPQINAWQSFQKPPLRISDGFGLATIGNYLYIVGGRNDQEIVNYTLSYQALYQVIIPIIPNP